jgi:hypothetical protein
MIWAEDYSRGRMHQPHKEVSRSSVMAVTDTLKPLYGKAVASCGRGRMPWLRQGQRGSSLAHSTPIPPTNNRIEILASKGDLGFMKDERACLDFAYVADAPSPALAKQLVCQSGFESAKRFTRATQGLRDTS